MAGTPAFLGLARQLIPTRPHPHIPIAYSYLSRVCSPPGLTGSVRCELGKDCTVLDVLSRNSIPERELRKLKNMN